MALVLRHRHPVKLYFFLNTDPAYTIQYTHKPQFTHQPKLKLLVELQLSMKAVSLNADPACMSDQKIGADCCSLCSCWCSKNTACYAGA